MKRQAVTELRYVKGSGRPPLHLASIDSSGAVAGDLVFTLANAAVLRIAFACHTERVGMLQRLIAERVPFAVGGMCPGPADEVGLLIDNGALTGPHLELSWSGPQQWVVREIAKNAHDWLPESDIGKITNPSFDPHSLSVD